MTLYHCDRRMNKSGQTVAKNQRYRCPKCGKTITDSDRVIGYLTQGEQDKLMGVNLWV